MKNNQPEIQRVVPAILSGNVVEVQKQLDEVKQFAGCHLVQIDVIDGWFADNVTITPTDFLELDFGQLQIDLHLMTEEPMDFVFEALEFKDRLPIVSITAQIEHMTSQTAFVEQVKSVGWQVGLSLDLFTPADSIDAEVWSKIDLIQVMGIEAGFQGQEFANLALEKILEIRQILKKAELGMLIMVDGGVKLSVLSSVIKAGVDRVMVGSALWQASDPVEVYREMVEEVEKHMDASSQA